VFTVGASGCLVGVYMTSEFKDGGEAPSCLLGLFTFLVKIKMATGRRVYILGRQAVWYVCLHFS
jgi:hypothetical protein